MQNELLGIDDINKALFSVLLSEEKVLRDGYEEGFRRGVCEGRSEGFHLGYHRGCELGYEIGFYKGFVQMIKHSIEKDCNKYPDRVTEAVAKLIKLIDEFPLNNVEDSDLITLRDEIRGRYKRLCSMLKIDVFLPVADNLAF